MFLIDSFDNILSFNYASNNTEYGININNSSRNNALNNNIANSNGKENIIFADPENNTINDPLHKAPFLGSAMTIATVMIMSLLTARKVSAK